MTLELNRRIGSGLAGGLAILALLAPLAHAGTTVTEGPWDRYFGNTLQQSGFASEAACVASATALNITRNYTCRTRTGVAVTTVVSPPPPPPPTPPTVSLGANPPTVAPNQTSTLSWSSTNATGCIAGGSWNGAKATSGSEATMALTATSTFSLACTGAAGTGNASTTVNVSGGSGAITGLDFPSNGSTNEFVAMQFTDVVNRGLPIWGPGNRGVTYLWRLMPRQQAGYYTAFFWAHNGSFEWNGGVPSSYYGATPYPQSQNSSGTVHHWSIAVDAGDIRTTNAGAMKPVVKGQWHNQALRVVVNAGGTKTLTFYTALPSLAAGDVITTTVSANYGGQIPPAPALTWGDNPWWRDYGHERLSGVVRGIKIFNKVLSEADTVTESQVDSLVTAEGLANVWYMNINPTPTDVTDKSGRGNHPTWGSAARPGLWAQ